MLQLCLPSLAMILFSVPLVAGVATVAESGAQTTIDHEITGSVDGAVTLTVGNQQVAAAYLPQTLGDYRGAIVLFHDKDSQLDSLLIHQLRKDLIVFGWDTFTISLDHPAAATVVSEQAAINAELAAPDSTTTEPVTESPAPDAAEATDVGEPANPDNTENQVDKMPKNNAARLDAALAWLQAKNPPRLVFVGHGAGVMTAIETINAIPQPVNALVMLSADAMVTSATLIDANLPVLDIIGSQAKAVDKHAAVMRRSQLKNTATQPYSQRQVYGADRDFSGMEALLGKQVHSWLYRQLIGDVQR